MSKENDQALQEPPNIPPLGALNHFRNWMDPGCTSTYYQPFGFRKMASSNTTL
jgi:hypothetical protein